LLVYTCLQGLHVNVRFIHCQSSSCQTLHVFLKTALLIIHLVYLETKFFSNNFQSIVEVVKPASRLGGLSKIKRVLLEQLNFTKNFTAKPGDF